MSTRWTNRTNYLLQQSFFFLLLQNYCQIVISGIDFSPWTGRNRADFLEKEDAFYLLLEDSGKIKTANPSNLGFVG